MGTFCFFAWLPPFIGADISPFSPQVWTCVQSCLILFSLATGIFVAASHNNLTFLRCLGREEAFRWWLQSAILETVFFHSDTTSPTSTSRTSFVGWNFRAQCGLQCAFSRTLPPSPLSLLCRLCMGPFTDFGRNIQQQHWVGWFGKSS